MYRSTVKVSDAKHQAAVAKGASEVSAGTVLYRHGGKLFTVRCTGTDIGAWEEGYPGTENMLLKLPPVEKCDPPRRLRSRCGGNTRVLEFSLEFSGVSKRCHGNRCLNNVVLTTNSIDY